MSISQHLLNNDSATPTSKEFCKSCKLKEKVIADLENQIYSLNNESKKTKEKCEPSPSKIFSEDKTMEGYLKTISEMQEQIDEKDAKLARVENLLKTLQFYNCFSAQQSHFVEYVSEMKRLETMNQKLLERIRVLEQDPRIYAKKPKKETNEKEKTNSPQKEKKDEENLLLPPEKIAKIIEKIGKGINEIENMVEGEEFYAAIGNIENPIVNEELEKLFEEKKKENEESGSAGSESDDSFSSDDSQAKEPKYKSNLNNS